MGLFAAEYSVEMELLGTIEPSNGAAAHREEWIALIAAHSSLEPAQPRQGINPFTKEPRMYKPAPDYACVMIDGTNVGAIHWAMDDSRRLVVSSLPTAMAPVTAIAKDVASRIGWRFIPGTHS